LEEHSKEFEEVIRLADERHRYIEQLERAIIAVIQSSSSSPQLSNDHHQKVNNEDDEVHSIVFDIR
jgi:hypothetical protein